MAFYSKQWVDAERGSVEWPVYAQDPLQPDDDGGFTIDGATVHIGGSELLHTLHAEAFSEQLESGLAVVLTEDVRAGGGRSRSSGGAGRGWDVSTRRIPDRVAP